MVAADLPSHFVPQSQSLCVLVLVIDTINAWNLKQEKMEDCKAITALV